MFGRDFEFTDNNSVVLVLMGLSFFFRLKFFKIFQQMSDKPDVTKLGTRLGLCVPGLGPKGPV